MSPDLLERVAAFLAENPDATIEDVQKLVRKRRSAVASAMKTVREGQHITPSAGTAGNRAELGSRPMRKRDPVKTSDRAPTWDEFMRVLALTEEPRVALIKLLGKVQRCPELRPVDDRLLSLVDRRLAFEREFEAELRETARFLGAFGLLAREQGRPPDSDVVEELLAADPATIEDWLAADPTPIKAEAPVLSAPSSPVSDGANDAEMADVSGTLGPLQIRAPAERAW
jgi:hypothetical protein